MDGAAVLNLGLVLIPLPYPAVRGIAVGCMAGAAAIGIWIAWSRDGRQAPRRPWRQALAMLAVALAFRAALSLVVDGGLWDIFNGYRFVGDHLRQGGDIFMPPFMRLANYPPLVTWWWAAAAAIVPSEHEHLFAALIRAPFWSLDAIIAPTLLLLRRDASGFRAGWIYALNPVAAAVPTLHGQFDPVVILPLLVATAVIARRPTIGGLLVGVAATVKLWPLYFALPLLALLPRGRRVATAAAMAVAPVLAFAVYGVIHPAHVGAGVVTVLFYVAHWQGLGTGFLTGDHAPIPILVIAEAIAASSTLAAGFWLARRGAHPAEVMGVCALVLLTLSPTISDQYLTWPLALLLLAGRLRAITLATAGIVPAILWIDLWVSQNQGSPRPALYLFSTLSTGLLAAWILFEPRLPRPAGAPAQLPA